MASQSLKWIPLGGLGEVGKNMMAFEYGKNILIVDTGVMFPESDMFGIDAVIPDYTYLKDKADMIRAIVITHGHEDHTGSIRYVVESFPGVPIYATPLTRGLLEVKLKEAKLLDKTTINTVQTDGEFTVGPFKVEFFRMSHSIPDNVGLAITTAAGTVVHSGDFKFDHTPVDGKPSDFGKLAELGNRGVLALFADSTNAEVPGTTPSERVIEPAFEHIFRDTDGRIIVATFASLISRIQQVMNVCEIYGRRLAIAGTSMGENVKMAQKMGYLKVPEGMLINKLEDAMKMPANQVAIMATGTQGEPSAVLARLATGRHPVITVQKGDAIVMSSHPIPGNDEAVHRIINQLFQKGVNVYYDPIAKVHVSGHACQEEQKLLMSLVRPKFFIPIHGELRMLKAHERLAQSVGIPPERIFVGENGTPVVFEDGEAEQQERVPGTYMYVDGNRIGEIGPAVLRERELLAQNGFVLIVLRRTEEGGLFDAPEIITRGLFYMKESEDLIKTLSDRLANALQDVNGLTDNALKDKAIESLNKIIYTETRRRPTIMAVVA